MHVALVEAGPDRRGVLANCTAAGMVAALVPRKNASNYGFATTAQAGLKQRSDFHPLGRGLGGGGAINSLMYLRGHRSDYDDWAAMGNPGWSYADVLPYFTKAENNQTHHDAFHGDAGPVWWKSCALTTPTTASSNRPAKRRACPSTLDFNGATQEGYNSVQVMMKGGERFHTGKAHINPPSGRAPEPDADDRHALTARSCSRGKRAVGVRCHGGQRQAPSPGGARSL
ncbi:MAG: GMC family oxidoreductase N-terminal domain-containing protein [Rhodoferax sp.]|nr:GMC family oxidoreductase N-terminal domain-containing protein [Rhodoferax sp.]